MDFRTRLRLSSAQRQTRGFTLLELMAVVVIMGILATVGLASFIKQARQARTTEVRAALKAICAAQERFRAENLVYYNVSNGLGTTANTAGTRDLSRLYPMAAPGGTKYDFWNRTSGNDRARWERLRPEIVGPVQFGYSTVAGLPNETAPTFAFATKTVTWPSLVVGPWYVVQAVGDQDGNGTNAVAVMTSFGSEVMWEKEVE